MSCVFVVSSQRDPKTQRPGRPDKDDLSGLSAAAGQLEPAGGAVPDPPRGTTCVSFMLHGAATVFTLTVHKLRSLKMFGGTWCLSCCFSQEQVRLWLSTALKEEQEGWLSGDAPDVIDSYYFSPLAIDAIQVSAKTCRWTLWFLELVQCAVLFPDDKQLPDGVQHHHPRPEQGSEAHGSTGELPLQVDRPSPPH